MECVKYYAIWYYAARSVKVVDTNFRGIIRIFRKRWVLSEKRAF